MLNNITLDSITEDIGIWIPGLDIIMPISTEDISGFQKWVNWNCFRDEGRNGLGMHRGHDFAAYINNEKACVVGLPPSTPIRSIADGIAIYIFCDVDPKTDPRAYSTALYIKHNEAGLVSEYLHVIPTVKIGQTVKRGEVIAKAYKTPENLLKDGDSLVHLHLGLGTYLFHCDLDICITDRVDPRKILPEKSDLFARPQLSYDFRIPKLRRKLEIILANDYHPN